MPSLSSSTCTGIFYFAFHSVWFRYLGWQVSRFISHQHRSQVVLKAVPWFGMSGAVELPKPKCWYSDLRHPALSQSKKLKVSFAAPVTGSWSKCERDNHGSLTRRLNSQRGSSRGERCSSCLRHRAHPVRAGRTD